MTDLTRNAQDDTVTADQNWTSICAVQDLPLNAGVAALLNADSPEETQIALFRTSDNDAIYAVSNFDPFSEALPSPSKLLTATCWLPAKPRILL